MNENPGLETLQQLNIAILLINILEKRPPLYPPPSPTLQTTTMPALYLKIQPCKLMSGGGEVGARSGEYLSSLSTLLSSHCNRFSSIGTYWGYTLNLVQGGQGWKQSQIQGKKIFKFLPSKVFNRVIKIGPWLTYI